MRYDLLIAGRGGQGILILGYVLGLALVKYGNYYVVETESYSAETRGGDSRVEMIIADNPQDTNSLRIRKANIAIFLYKDQAIKYKDMVKPNSLVIIDSTFLNKSPSNNWNAHLVPLTNLAMKYFNTPRVTNMIALGYFISKTKIINLEAIVKSIREVMKPEWMQINVSALNFGYNLGKEFKDIKNVNV